MKRKGFTLIELLAVIVIISVIAIITTPIILNVIETAKRNAFIESVRGTLRAAEIYETTGEEIPEDGISIKDLPLKGADYIGKVYFKDSTYLVENFTNGTYCANGSYNDIKVEKGNCEGISNEPKVTFTLIEKTTRSIKVKTDIIDYYEIIKEEYCSSKCEEEGNWVEGKGSYTFDRLKNNSDYTVKVRVTNKLGYITEKSLSVTTNELEKSTYSITPNGWQKSKNVTISYPEGTENYYKVTSGTVKVNGVLVTNNEKIKVTGRTINLVFETNGTIVAITSDGVNELTAANLDVSQIDTTLPSGSFSPNSTGNTNTNRNVTFTPSDTGSGVSSWRYRVSTNNESTYGSWTAGGAITLPYADNIKLQAEVTDNAGNVNTITSGTLYAYNECGSGNTTTTTGGYSACNKACGSGTQSRTDTIKDNRTGKVCSTPSYSQACNTQSCGLLSSGLRKGTTVYVNPETKSICDASSAVSITGTKTGCMKWYVYKDNGDSTYQLILDHNTTSKVAWNSSGLSTDGMKEISTTLINDTISWDNSLKNNNVRLITADEVAEITGANSNSTIKWSSGKPSGTTIDTHSSWFYLDGGKNINKMSYSSTDGWQKLYSTTTSSSEYAWLFDNTNECTLYGCNVADSSNYGYWTSTPVFDNINRAWVIDRAGILSVILVVYGDNYGVRPVITI